MNLEELKTINEIYLKLEVSLKEKIESYVDIKARLAEAINSKDIMYGRFLEAKIMADPDEDSRKEKYEEAVKYIVRLENELGKKKRATEYLQTQIEECMEALKKDPELKVYLEKAVKEKHKKDLQEKYTELAQHIEQKDDLTEAKMSMEKYPFLEEGITGIIQLTKKYQDRKTEIDLDASMAKRPYTDKEKVELEEMSGKIAECKNGIVTKIAEMGCKISKRKLDKMILMIRDDSEIASAVIQGKALNCAITDKSNQLQKRIDGNTKVVQRYENILTRPKTTKTEVSSTENTRREESDEVENEEENEEEKSTLFSKAKDGMKNIWFRITHRNQKALSEGGEKNQEEEEEIEEKPKNKIFNFGKLKEKGFFKFGKNKSDEEEIEEEVLEQKSVEEFSETKWKEMLKCKIVEDFAKYEADIIIDEEKRKEKQSEIESER